LNFHFDPAPVSTRRTIGALGPRAAPGCGAARVSSSRSGISVTAPGSIPVEVYSAVSTCSSTGISTTIP
jgi:hypothetical protein